MKAFRNMNNSFSKWFFIHHKNFTKCQTLDMIKFTIKSISAIKIVINGTTYIS